MQTVCNSMWKIAQHLHAFCTNLAELPRLNAMKNTSLSAEEIVLALQQREAGEPVEQICARFGISVATFYNMRKRYSGLSVSVLKQVRELEIEKLKLTKTIEVLKQDQVILPVLFIHIVDICKRPKYGALGR